MLQHTDLKQIHLARDKDLFKELISTNGVGLRFLFIINSVQRYEGHFKYNFKGLYDGTIIYMEVLEVSRNGDYIRVLRDCQVKNKPPVAEWYQLSTFWYVLNQKGVSIEVLT